MVVRNENPDSWKYIVFSRENKNLSTNLVFRRKKRDEDRKAE